jgi:hypothetical protein
MANTTQDEIYRSFLEASQQQSAQFTAASQSLAGLILQADQVRQDMAEQTAGVASAVRSSSRGPSGTAQSSTGGSVFSDVMGVFGSGLSPLVKGIFSLFGGGGDTAAPSPLVKYAMPASVDFQAAEVGGQVMSADYDQTGGARGYGARSASQVQAPASAGGSAAAAAPAPQITVNVSAMDARSFMDRSGDIAAAVRDAMLNLNSINDVVSEL